MTTCSNIALATRVSSDFRVSAIKAALNVRRFARSDPSSDDFFHRVAVVCNKLTESRPSITQSLFNVETAPGELTDKLLNQIPLNRTQ